MQGLHLTIILNASHMFIRIIRGRLKLSNLHYQNHVQKQIRKFWGTVQQKSGRKFL